MPSLGDIIGEDSADTLKAFANNPRGFILGFVATWLVNGVLNGTEYVVRGLLDGLAPLAQLPEDLLDLLADGLGPLAEVLLWFPEQVVDMFRALEAASGPFAPVVVPAVAALLAYGAVKYLPMLLAPLNPGISAAWATLSGFIK